MILRTLLIALVLALAVGGYPLVASIMSLLGAGEARLPSVVLRFLVAALALATFFISWRELRLYHRSLFSALAIFWVAYVFRAIHDGFIDQDMSNLYQPSAILMYIFIFVVIPTLPFILGLNKQSAKAAYQLLFLITAATVALIIFDSRELLFTLVEQNSIRFRLEKLNPISVGFVGGTMVLLCTVGVFANGKLIKPSLPFYLLGGAAGLFVLMISASKGPVGAVLIALLFFWFLPLRPTRLFVGGVLAFIAGAVVFRLKNFILRKFDFDVSTRFITAVEDGDEGVETRQIAFDGAWQQFKDNPLFGDALFERITGGYPHNLVLEAFMATGIIGGIAYLLCLAFMFWACIKLLLRASGQEWLALLAIFAAVEAQFSGSHWAFGGHWVLLVAVVVTEIITRQNSPYAQTVTASRSERSSRRRRGGSRQRRAYS